MRKLLVEAIGTFMLVAVICGATLISFAAESGSSGILGVAMAAGFSVAAMMYAVGPISGGHFNPAITCGLCAAGRFPLRSILPYSVAHVVGGALAGLLFYIILSSKIGWTPGTFAANGFGEHSPGGFPATAGFATEAIMTALLVFVFCRVTREKSGAGLAAPLAIGFTFAALHVASMPITNTSL
ncbi:MAG: aquaporin, partial [Aestuariivirgaceae bacterium]